MTNENSLPEKLCTGFLAEIQLSVAAAGKVESSEDRGSVRYSNSCFNFSVKGEHYFCVSEKGWNVFVYGAAKDVSGLVGDVLDKCFPGSPYPEFSSSAFKHLKEDLCWRLLPSAAVIAVHPESGSACVLRDGAGFVPIYYGREQGKVILSSNLGSVRHAVSSTGINTDVLSNMFVYGHSLIGRSVWQGIDIVAPGQGVLFVPGKPPQRAWFWTPDTIFDPGERKRIESLSVSQALEEVGRAVDESLKPLESMDEINVPCGGGVDSSLLGAYLAKKGHKVTFWCINQPDAPLTEEEWMNPLSRQLNIPCEYANLHKESFLDTLLSQMILTQQPFVGPNSVGGILARQLSLEKGDTNFISGEMCDTVFGGLGPIGRLRKSIRSLRFLSLLPYRLRMQLYRALIGNQAWLLDSTQIDPVDEQAMIGFGSLESAEKINESTFFEGSVAAGKLPSLQEATDSLTWIQLRDVACGLNPIFFEKDEWLGGATYYPFAHASLLKLGVHLPYSMKVKGSHKKWLWRQFASQYIGNEVAFRKKYGFPTLTGTWLAKAGSLLKQGFLEELFCCDVDTVFNSLPSGHSARWTLVNLELWGRLHVLRQSKETIIEKLL